MPLELVHVTRLTPEPEIRTVGRPSCSMNSGSSVISVGEIVVKSRVRYGQFARSESAWRAGAMMREESADANFAASQFCVSIVSGQEAGVNCTPAKQL